MAHDNMAEAVVYKRIIMICSLDFYVCTGQNLKLESETPFGSVTLHEICKSNFATFATVYHIKLVAYLHDVFLCYLSHLLKLVYHKFRFTVSMKQINNLINFRVKSGKAKKRKRLFFDNKNLQFQLTIPVKG